MTNQQILTYPIYLNMREVRFLLGMGNTYIYNKIKSGELQKVKFGRATRITFVSVIKFAAKSFKAEIYNENSDQVIGMDEGVELQHLAELLMIKLCNTYSTHQTDQITSEKQMSIDIVGQKTCEPCENKIAGEFS